METAPQDPEARPVSFKPKKNLSPLLAARFVRLRINKIPASRFPLPAFFFPPNQAPRTKHLRFNQAPATHHQRQMLRTLRFHRINELQFASQNSLVEEHHAAQRLILSTRCDLSFHSQVRQEIFQFRRPKLFELLAAHMFHETLHPADVCCLGAQRVMHQPQLSPHLLNRN